MREILFRGKRLSDGVIVEGFYLIKTDPLLLTKRHFILVQLNNANGILNSTCAWFEVDPATVGQYTGLQDKNGERIFEGDICRIDDDELWVFSFGNCGGVENVGHEVGYMGFHLSPLSPVAIKNRGFGQRDDPVYYLNSIDLCVIGNIHDNPELMEVQSDGE